MGNVFIPAATVHVRVGDEILISGVGAASTLVASVPTLIQQAGDLFMAAQPGDTTIFASIPSCYGGAEASGHPAADCRTPIVKIVAS